MPYAANMFEVGVADHGFAGCTTFQSGSQFNKFEPHGPNTMSPFRGWPRNLIKAHVRKFGPLQPEDPTDPQRVVLRTERFGQGFDTRVKLTWEVDGSGSICSTTTMQSLAALSSSSAEVADQELRFAYEDARAILAAAGVPNGSPCFWIAEDGHEWLPAHHPDLPVQPKEWRKVSAYQMAAEFGFGISTKESIACAILKQVDFIQRRRHEERQDDELGLAWKELGRLESALDVLTKPHPLDSQRRPAFEAFMTVIKRVLDTSKPRAKWHTDAIAYCNRRKREEAERGKNVSDVQLARELIAVLRVPVGLEHAQQQVGKWRRDGEIVDPGVR